MGRRKREKGLKKCPDCKAHLRDGLCPYCGWDAEEGVETGLLRGTCPNGCGPTSFKREGSWLTCQECSESFIDAFVKLDGPPQARFGICTECHTPGLFDGGQTGYTCRNCKRFGPLSEVMMLEVDEVPNWSGEDYTGCYLCGSPYSVAGSPAPRSDCAVCGTILLEEVAIISAPCPRCRYALDTLHLGLQGAGHHFFCLDCGVEFQRGLAVHGACGTPGCHLATESSDGITFYCRKCKREFVQIDPDRRDLHKRGVYRRTQGVVIGGDTTWSEKILEGKLAKKYLVLDEI